MPEEIVNVQHAQPEPVGLKTFRDVEISTDKRFSAIHVLECCAIRWASLHRRLKKLKDRQGIASYGSDWTRPEGLG